VCFLVLRVLVEATGMFFGYPRSFLGQGGDISVTPRVVFLDGESIFLDALGCIWDGEMFFWMPWVVF